MKTLITTLCIVHKHPHILLGMKKRGFGAGRWNGFGGKVEIETIEENIKRETREECGIEIQNMEQVGLMDFEFEGNPEFIQVHVFKINKFTGEPEESEEMKPQWFHVDEIPFNKMWPDDTFWIPILLQGKKFKGKFIFNRSNSILEKDLQEVEKI